MRFPMFLFVFGFLICKVLAVPVVIKESSPHGESVISISSSDPAVEKYILEYAAERAKHSKPSPAFSGRSQAQGSVVRSFSVSTPEKTIVGTGRSFGDSSFDDSFFAPYFAAPNVEGFDIRDWLRSLDSFYEPRYSTSGTGGNGRKAQIGQRKP